MFTGTVNFERKFPSPKDNYGVEKLGQRIADCLREATDWFEIVLAPDQAASLGKEVAAAHIGDRALGVIAGQLEKTSVGAMAPADRAAALIVEAILQGAPALWNLIEAQKAEIMISRDVSGVSVEIGWPEDSHPMKIGSIAAAR